MRITKYTHACVRVEHEGRVLVIDPGIWSEPHALRDADAVLVTHMHADHIDPLRLIGLGVEVFAPVDAEIPVMSGDRQLAVTGVASGQEFTAAGFRVRATGGRHAFIYNGQPDCANLGYVVEDSLYHPGDSLDVPDQPVETLLVPAQASWLKMTEAVDFVRAVKPERTFAIHDAQVNERGLGSINAWFEGQTDAGYRWLAPGETA